MGLIYAQDLVFFFQAEDGIRDVAVTGVQTCALPICRVSDPTREARARACAYGWSVSDAAREGQSSPADAVSATASVPPCPSAAQPHYTNSTAHTAPRTIAAGSRPDEPPATRGSPAGCSLLLVGLAPAKGRSPGKYAGRKIRSPAKK